MAKYADSKRIAGKKERKQHKQARDQRKNHKWRWVS